MTKLEHLELLRKDVLERIARMAQYIADTQRAMDQARDELAKLEAQIENAQLP